MCVPFDSTAAAALTGGLVTSSSGTICVCTTDYCNNLSTLPTKKPTTPTTPPSGAVQAALSMYLVFIRLSVIL